MGNVIAKNDPEVQNLDVATVKQAFKEKTRQTVAEISPIEISCNTLVA